MHLLLLVFNFTMNAFYVLLFCILGIFVPSMYMMSAVRILMYHFTIVLFWQYSTLFRQTNATHCYVRQEEPLQKNYKYRRLVMHETWNTRPNQKEKNHRREDDRGCQTSSKSDSSRFFAELLVEN